MVVLVCKAKGYLKFQVAFLYQDMGWVMTQYFR